MINNNNPSSLTIEKVSSLWRNGMKSLEKFVSNDYGTYYLVTDPVTKTGGGDLLLYKAECDRFLMKIFQTCVNRLKIFCWKYVWVLLNSEEFPIDIEKN